MSYTTCNILIIIVEGPDLTVLQRKSLLRHLVAQSQVLPLGVQVLRLGFKGGISAKMGATWKSW